MYTSPTASWVARATVMCFRFAYREVPAELAAARCWRRQLKAACCKPAAPFGGALKRPRGTDQLRGRVVLVDEHHTSRVSSAVNGQQPCESQLNKRMATRPADWKPPAGQVHHCLVRPAWSQQRDQSGPAMLAAVVALTSGFLPFTPPPPSHAAQELKVREQYAVKPAAIHRRAKAEANLMSGKEAMQAKIAAAEAKVDEGNEARRRLAEERSQVVSSQSLQAYDTAAAKAVQVAPPL
ncbi:hypothetical protein QJQ45_004027 [Haematococcus lacustris]|nr:hypothetical protein QJQ45_004027 [Haematococcus lacustris]